MKKIIKYFLSVVVILTVASCQQDDTNDNGPNTNLRDDYLGTWNCVENTGISSPQFYIVEITAGNGNSDIVINGLYNISGTTVRAVIDGLMITIPSQTSNDISFSGSGQANTDLNQVNLNFTANDGSGNDVIEAVLTR